MSQSAVVSVIGEQGTPGITVASGALTDTGLVRNGNEDAFVAQFPIFIVADGMGGHRAGEVASSKVIEEMEAHICADDFVDAVRCRRRCITRRGVLLIWDNQRGLLDRQ